MTNYNCDSRDGHALQLYNCPCGRSGGVFCIIVHKLNLTSGVIPSMGMAMALINFFTVQTWNAALTRLRFTTLPFTPQVLQMACHHLGLPFPWVIGGYR